MSSNMEAVRTDKPDHNGPHYAQGMALPRADTHKVLRNTYLLLALTMIPTIVGAYVGMSTAAVLVGHPMMSALIVFGAVIALQHGIISNRNSSLGVVLLLLMTGILGWWLGPLLTFVLAMQNGAGLVGYAAAGTGLIFFVMGGIATTTQSDFGFMSKFLFVGMMALLAAMAANLFMHIPAFALTISTLVIIVFSLYLLYDLNRIVRGGETNYIVATTGVYLSLFNIFANLLSIIAMLSGGGRR